MLAALCFATVLALALGSYMTLCYTTLATSNRNVHSAHSQELVETGMEEVLWTLKANSNAGDWSGWSIAGTKATKTISNYATYSNGVTGSITLTVTNYTNTTGTRNVTVTGTTAQADGTVLSSRTVTASSAPAPLFVNALSGTTGNVTFSSAGTVDSYDSSQGLYAAQTPTYAATVASSATVSTTSPAATVQLVNAQIKGYVASLYSGGPSYSSSAKVVGPTTPAATKIDPSRISTSPYQGEAAGRDDPARHPRQPDPRYRGPDSHARGRPDFVLCQGPHGQCRPDARQPRPDEPARHARAPHPRPPAG